MHLTEITIATARHHEYQLGPLGCQAHIMSCASVRITPLIGIIPQAI